MQTTTMSIQIGSTVTQKDEGISKVNMPMSKICKQRTRCEIWTRVMGYHRPLSHFNIGKKAEHCSRQHFEEVVSANSEFCKKY